MGPPEMLPSGFSLRYSCASVQLLNLAVMPNMAITHIQNTAPGPPAWIAMATPAILPRPTVAESALVHVPLYVFKYVYNDEIYAAVVEGATGQVLANIYPAKAEAPYLAVAGLTAGVFLCLASAPVLGALIFGGEGLLFGAMALLGLGIPAGLALFALATWVASKV